METDASFLFIISFYICYISIALHNENNNRDVLFTFIIMMYSYLYKIFIVEKSFERTFSTDLQNMKSKSEMKCTTTYLYFTLINLGVKY